ncbi:centriole and centriolar satellite protein OFD1 [Helicoverpa armigera]|uniref:centriole and centriolar satellite protein OFD1 n=1 Tax=Helicoverpa armigera TaxID=29058 RepID=UPI003082ABF4
MTQTKILFYRNQKGGPSNVILHKSEWNRLKKQGGPPEKPAQLQNESYLNALIEKSQGWIKTWPDTVQGCIALRGKQKEKRRAQEIANAEAFSKKELKNTKHLKEAIEKARQKIFDESCYGKKLISALRESKTLEEREAQIKFKKEIKEKESKLEEKKSKSVKFCTFDLDKNADAAKDKQKCVTIETSKMNKEMHDKLKEDQAQAKEQERLSALNDALQMKFLLIREQEAEDKIKLLEKQALEQFVAEDKKTKEERAKWEAEYYAKIEACRQHQEELNCKIRQVHLRMNKKNQESELFKKTFEAIKKCKEEENKRLDDFLEKSIAKGEQRAAKSDRKVKDKIIQDRKNKMSIAEVNKTMNEYVKQMECSPKCFCERQCIITKSDIPPVLKKRQAEIKSENKVTTSYFAPSNKLVDALRKREQEPKPWTGADAAHVLFMRNAVRTLQDSKYKLPAKKVVDVGIQKI